MPDDKATDRAANSECVLIHAPLGRDALLAAHALLEIGVSSQVCETTTALRASLQPETTALLLTIDGLQASDLERIGTYLHAQPPWSDLPVILLANTEASALLEEVMPLLGNVTLLQRPLRRSSLLSAVQSALRARRRQYQVRDLLAETERARMEAERQQKRIETLNEQLKRAMTETHHRVKNNLQVIAAMVDMQVMEQTSMLPVSEFRRLGSHIHMLAAVHDLLTSQAKEDGLAHYVSSEDVMHKLLPLMQQLSGRPLAKVTVVDVPLTAKQGTSLALVMNELVSNAYKHGNGHVEVSFTTLGPEAILEVCDDGPGFAPDFNPLKAAHTGLELVESLSRWDLFGHTRYQTRETGGGQVSVTMPLAPAA